MVDDFERDTFEFDSLIVKCRKLIWLLCLNFQVEFIKRKTNMIATS